MSFISITRPDLEAMIRNMLKTVTESLQPDQKQDVYDWLLKIITELRDEEQSE